MKIPLLCDVRSESLEIVSNGRLSIRSLPFPPHIYIPITKAGPRTLTRRRIGTEEDVEISRVEYDTVDELEKVYMRTECHKLHYIEQIYTEEEDYFLQYPNTNPLRILVLDIEVLTDGSGIFPRASSNPIVAIGMKVVGGDEYIYAASQDELDSPGSDGRILREMMAQFKVLNPDIIGTYNGVEKPANARIEALTIYRRPLFDGTYGVDVGNGDEIAAIYNSGNFADPCEITGSWDVVVCFPTDATPGALVSG